MNRRRIRIRPATLGFALVATATALVGASSSAAVAAPAAVASARSCTGGHLALGYHDISGGVSHGGIVLTFRNRGGSICTLYGYPGFDDVNAHDAVLEHAKRTFEGYLGGSHKHSLEKVRVKPGHSASAVVEWEAVTRSGRTCRTAPGFDFTAAGTGRTAHRGVRVATVCALQVHPTVPGRSGQRG